MSTDSYSKSLNELREILVDIAITAQAASQCDPEQFCLYAFVKANDALTVVDSILGDASTRKDEASLHHRPDESVQQCANTSLAQPSEIPVLSDNQMYALEAEWKAITPLEKLAWFNGMAKRQCPPAQYWLEILELANHFATREPVMVSLPVETRNRINKIINGCMTRGMSSEAITDEVCEYLELQEMVHG